jgi:hypothetical protein
MVIPNGVFIQVLAKASGWSPILDTVGVLKILALRLMEATVSGKSPSNQVIKKTRGKKL